MYEHQVFFILMLNDLFTVLYGVHSTGTEKLQENISQYHFISAFFYPCIFSIIPVAKVTT
jgi:hypothetical membrane protein